MDKNEALEHLRDAKKAHLKWLQRAKALISNIPVEKDAIPVDYTECAFGQWFYSEGQEIALMPGMDSIGEIGKKHEELHDEYIKIFKIYFGDANKTLFSKLFNLRKKVTDAEQDVARRYYSNLKDISDELLKHIEKLERRINALPQSAFDRD
ncbi:CZB domain-containing protein [bacterium]|nr:CZB domain-containing protein [bacterium]MBU1883853.1 CZB domain-containing protein [bacterium]